MLIPVDVLHARIRKTPRVARQVGGFARGPLEEPGHLPATHEFVSYTFEAGEDYLIFAKG